MTTLDDLVAEPLQSWDAALLVRLRTDGKSETLFFEFKSVFDCADVEKTVCAFANRLGGFLLLGVEADTADNRITRFPGLSPDDWLRRVSDCIMGHVSPLPTWDTVAIASPDAPERLIVVTRVEESVNTPHLVVRTGRIYVRNPAGSDPVSDRATLDTLIARGRQARTARDRRISVIGLLREELGKVPRQMGDRQNRSYPPHDFMSDILWRSLSSSGELRWIEDLDLLRKIAAAYELLVVEIDLERQWLHSRATVGAGRDGGGLYRNQLQALDFQTWRAACAACKAMDAALVADGVQPGSNAEDLFCP